MPSLKSLLGTKNREIVEYNLEKGKIWTYGTSGMYNTACNCGCWCAPGSGSVTLEVWGAGGSGARMCCCGMGVPGNSGAYSKKQFNVTQGIITCGTAGRSCGNSDALCFRGCSEATQVCWRSSDSGATGCICSQGGRGGITFCTTGASPYCCFAANGFCATKLDNENCGLICNKCSGSFEANAYGGDLNKPGTVSCSLFAECYANNTACGYTYHIAMPPGVLSKESSMITFSPEADSVITTGVAQAYTNSKLRLTQLVEILPMAASIIRVGWVTELADVMKCKVASTMYRLVQVDHLPTSAQVFEMVPGAAALVALELNILNRKQTV